MIGKNRRSSRIACLAVIALLHGGLGWAVMRVRSTPPSEPRGPTLSLSILPNEKKAPDESRSARPMSMRPPSIVPLLAPEIAVSSPVAPAPAPAAAAQPTSDPAPAAMAGPSVTPSPTAGAAVAIWRDLVRRRLDQAKIYPQLALGRRQQGVAYLRFILNRDGMVLFAALDRSSGFSALDAETLALVHRAEPLPTAPAEMMGERFELVIPMQFFLRSPDGRAAR